MFDWNIVAYKIDIQVCHRSELTSMYTAFDDRRYAILEFKLFRCIQPLLQVQNKLLNLQESAMGFHHTGRPHLKML